MKIAKVLEPVKFKPFEMPLFRDVLTSSVLHLEKYQSDTVYAHTEGETVRLGNGFLEAEIRIKHPIGFVNIKNKVTDELFSLKVNNIFLLETDQGVYAASHFQASQSSLLKGDEEIILRIELMEKFLDVTVVYQLRRNEHFIRKWVDIENKSNRSLILKKIVLEDVTYEDGVISIYSVNPTMEINDLTVLEHSRGGFFSFIEFPYYQTEVNGRSVIKALHIGEIMDGKGFLSSEKLVLGVYQKRKGKRFGLNEGARDWIREYVYTISPLRKSPIVYFHGYCDGNFNLGINNHRVDKLLEILPQLDIKYAELQNFFDNILQEFEKTGGSPADWFDRFSSQGVYLGTCMLGYNTEDWWRGERSNEVCFFDGYSEKSSDYFNPIYKMDLGKLRIECGPDVKPACLASKWVDIVCNMWVKIIRDLKFRLVNLDGLWFQQCNSLNHNHLPDESSLYQIYKSFTELLQKIRSLDPRAVVYSGSMANWSGPQFVKHLDFCLTGLEDLPAGLPDISLDRLYAALVRSDFKMAHGASLLPSYRLRNGIGHYGWVYSSSKHKLWHKDMTLRNDSPHSKCGPFHDNIGWRFNFLSAIALGAQVMCFNHLYDYIPESDIAFAKKWLSWAEEKKEFLVKTKEIFGNPLLGEIDGYTHIIKDNGFIFVFNSSFEEKIGELKIQLEVEDDQLFLVKELYPEEMNVLGPKNGFFKQKSTLSILMPANGVKIMEIRPAPEKMPDLMIFGTKLLKKTKCKGRTMITMAIERSKDRKIGIRKGEEFTTVNIKTSGKPIVRQLRNWKTDLRREGATYETRFKVPEDLKKDLKAVSKYILQQHIPDFLPLSEVAVQNKEFMEELQKAYYLDPKANYVESFKPYPWAYTNRIYLILPLEKKSDVVPEYIKANLGRGRFEPISHLKIKVWVNDTEVEVFPFYSGSHGPAFSLPPQIFCYFADITNKIKFGQSNKIQLFIQKRKYDEGIIFKGAYLENIPVKAETVTVEV